MPCEVHTTPDGAVIMICCRGSKKSTPCFVCGRPSTSLCDYPIGKGKTCDRPLCNSCKTSIGPNLDVCSKHSNPADIQITRLGGAGVE